MFEPTFNKFSQITSYVDTLLIKVTYVQEWLHPGRQVL